MKSLILLIGRLIPILVLSGLLISCQPGQKQIKDQPGEIHLTVDPANLPPFAKLSELFKSVRIIPLETTSQSLIGYTRDVWVGDRSLLISTGDPTFEIFHFTPDGKFRNKIGSQGKGPGEFTDVSNLVVMKDSANVYVQGRSMRKILEYSFDGKYIREILFGKGLYDAAILDQNRIAFTTYKNYEVLIVNDLTGDTLKYIKTLPGQGSQIKSFCGDPSMGFYYTALGRDTIWKIGPASMDPLIICDFGAGHFSSTEYISSIGREGGYPPGHLSIGGGVLYGSGYYHFSLLRENEQKEYTYCRVVVEANSGKSWHLEQGPESDDILFCTSADFRTVASSGEWVSVVGAHELMEALPKIRGNGAFSYPPELVRQIEKMTLEDNPVLVLYTLKKKRP